LIFGLSFDDEIFIPALVAVLENQLSLGMVFQILLRRIDLGSFLMVAARSIILAIFVPDATSSTMVIHALGSPATSTQLLFSGILVLVLLPMVIDYFNGCVRARSLGIATQIKIMGEYVGIFRSMIRYLSSAASRKV
jgi:hypothetical protein